MTATQLANSTSPNTASPLHRGVLIASLDAGQWAAEFGMSLVDTCTADALGPNHIVGHLRRTAPHGDLAGARNAAVRRFLTTDAEWLWWLDTDVSFPADTLPRLLDAAHPDTRPVVGGLYFGWHELDLEPGTYNTIGQWQPMLLDYIETPEHIGWRPWPGYPPDGVVPVHGTGSGCVLIHRAAFEAVAAEFGPRWYRNIEDERIADRGGAFSEDLSFCIRLAAVGIPVHVHTGIKCGHHKGAVVGSERTWRDQAAIRGRSALRDEAV